MGTTRKPKAVKTEDAPTYVPDDKTAQENRIISQAMSILEGRLSKHGPVMSNPDATRQYLKLKLTGLEQELFYVLFLDSQHQLISAEEVFRGTVDNCSVYPREVVKRALYLNASAVILAHNHPSGLPEPSAADRYITDKLKDALALIEVKVLDHFVVGNTLVSFAERGWI